MHSFVVLAVFIASALAAGPRPTCNTDVKVATTDLCTDIAEKWGTNVTAIQTMNANATCSPSVGIDSVCVRQQTVACTLNETASSTTCDAFLTSYNLTEAQFIQLNNDVSDCDSLTVGSTYCVSNVYCFPGNTDELCTGHVTR
ncbi:unnamed protein product [Peniophora sp. CBMAI 1063]|nr:unnamed protein product [Peniophora sp. CBMAI 1063]